MMTGNLFQNSGPRAIYNTLGSALSAQTTRLNTIASNLANAQNTYGSEAQVYKARHPVFKTVQQNAFLQNNQSELNSEQVTVDKIAESKLPAIKRYQPGHPLADENGYIYMPNISVMGEMTDMIAASRAYEFNLAVFNDVKQLELKTLQLGEQ